MHEGEAETGVLEAFAEHDENAGADESERLKAIGAVENEHAGESQEADYDSWMKIESKAAQEEHEKKS